ncbi:hypothetical protein B0T20DRAFT_80455 [Sordaria brevicollis]|uniref:Uncharacterized protein n=1 Tax=Sordaria brevicollis TaxID=83679 RepID=A0AAE0P1B3_SORBR|nr:hypothetical protein B0T20DRAFT_80455 [Sordaria brevicollis]
MKMFMNTQSFIFFDSEYLQLLHWIYYSFLKYSSYLFIIFRILNLREPCQRRIVRVRMRMSGALGPYCEAVPTSALVKNFFQGRFSTSNGPVAKWYRVVLLIREDKTEVVGSSPIRIVFFASLSFNTKFFFGDVFTFRNPTFYSFHFVIGRRPVPSDLVDTIGITRSYA